MRDLKVKFEDTAREMADSLLEAAEEHEVDISGITIENFNYLLDDEFGDGGEVRCERFADIAWDYSFQFGEMDSEGFDDAQWCCIERAIEIVQAELGVEEEEAEDDRPWYDGWGYMS